MLRLLKAHGALRTVRWVAASWWVRSKANAAVGGDEIVREDRGAPFSRVTEVVSVELFAGMAEDRVKELWYQ